MEDERRKYVQLDIDAVYRLQQRYKEIRKMLPRDDVRCVKERFELKLRSEMLDAILLHGEDAVHKWLRSADDRYASVAVAQQLQRDEVYDDDDE